MWKTRLLALVFGATLGWTNSEASETQSHRKTRKEPSAIAAQPTTIRVALGKEARELVQRRLKQGTLSVLRLKIADMELPPEHSLIEGIRVFIGHPKANAKTRIKGHPHYVGSFVFGLQRKQTVFLNLAHVVPNLHKRKKDFDLSKPIEITFVPIPKVGSAPLPKDLKIPFRKVTIELPGKNEDDVQKR